MELEGDVNFLFDEQVIQDERLFSLEQTVFVLDEEGEGILDLKLYTKNSLQCNSILKYKMKFNVGKLQMVILNIY